MAEVELRTYVFLDSLQPQYAAFLGTVAQGFLPLAGDASLWVEISPGIEINRLTDVALKATRVRPGMQIVERYYGLLEVHSGSQAEARAAGAAILDDLGLKESERLKPRILSSQIVRHVDDHQVQLINRMRHGHMLIPGQTLYVMEVEPEKFDAFAKLMVNVPFGQIGKVTVEQTLVVRAEDGRTVVEADIAALKQAWQKPFDW